MHSLFTHNFYALKQAINIFILILNILWKQDVKDLQFKTPISILLYEELPSIIINIFENFNPIEIQKQPNDFIDLQIILFDILYLRLTKNEGKINSFETNIFGKIPE